MTSHVFLEVASQPVVDHRIANVVLEKLSRLQASEKLSGAKYLLLYTGSITAKARQDLCQGGEGYAVVSERHMPSECTNPTCDHPPDVCLGVALASFS